MKRVLVEDTNKAVLSEDYANVIAPDDVYGAVEEFVEAFGPEELVMCFSKAMTTDELIEVVEQMLIDFDLELGETVDSENVYDMLGELGDSIDWDSICQDMVAYLSDDELSDLLTYIFNQYDFESSYFDNEDEDFLTEETHPKGPQPAVDVPAAHAAASDLAKEKNLPVIFGYMGADKHGKYRYFEIKPIVCDDLKKCTAKVMKQYHPAGSILVAYPCK